jgi:mevalonate kinase
MALSIPFAKFNAGFAFPGPNGYTDPDGPRSNVLLRQFSRWLLNSSSFVNRLDLDGFKTDLKMGLFLESTIPQGCGVGSSGALCAAIFRRYAMESRLSGSSGQENLQELKALFSEMEAYFHGTSSGLDPLTCYLDSPVLVDTEGNIKIAAMPYRETSHGIDAFILSTGQPRIAAALVGSFIEKSRQIRFMDRITGIMMPLVNTCIESMLKPDHTAFMTSLAGLSRYQFCYMEPMIPESLHDLWERGLESGDYCLKLCGAGGGGFFLGFTSNMEKTAGIFAASGLKIIPVPMEHDPAYPGSAAGP